MAKVKVAGIQMACVEERAKNLAKAVTLARMAAEHGAGIICFQQLFSTPWFPRERDERHFVLAESEDGETLAALRPVAAETGTTLVCPIFERTPEGACHNTAVVIGPDGALLGRYRKVHVPELPLWEERFYFAPGDAGFPVFESHGLRFGVQLCWANFFPARLGAERGRVRDHPPLGDGARRQRHREQPLRLPGQPGRARAAAGLLWTQRLHRSRG